MALVSLVDDHHLFSTSMAVALRAEGFEVQIPRLTSQEDVCQTIMASQPQVVMIDRDLGALGSGEELIPPIAKSGLPIIVVSASLDDVVAGRCLSLGAAVCVAKSDPFEMLLTSVVRVANGDPSVNQSERYRLIDAWRRWQASADATSGTFDQLTRREAHVLGLLIEGRSVKAIANENHVSMATVRTQVRGILTKLDVSSQLEAVALALRARWPRPPLGDVIDGAPRPPHGR
jgi:two-component system, NarL family, nitrate/nitrite response regulator NarL